MSDRIFSFTVTLDSIYKDEDAEEIKSAIEMIKGVSEVVPQVADSELYFAISSAKRELRNKLFDVLSSKE